MFVLNCHLPGHGKRTRWTSTRWLTSQLYVCGGRDVDNVHASMNQWSGTGPSSSIADSLVASLLLAYKVNCGLETSTGHFLLFVVNARQVGQDVHDGLAEGEPDGQWKGHRHQSDLIVDTLPSVEDYSSITSSARKLKKRSNHWPDQVVARWFSKATVTVRLRSTVRDLQHRTRGEGQTTASIYFKLRIFLYRPKLFSCDIILFLKISL